MSFVNRPADALRSPSDEACLCHEMVAAYVRRTAPASLAASVVLDLGCGSNKLKGSVGLDVHPAPGVDVICDLNAPIWPVRGSSVDAVWSNQLVEHVADVVAFLEQLHTCVRPGADIVLLAPHYSSTYAWSDPTHRRGVALLSLDYACSYLPGKYAVVHRFFGLPTAGRGLTGLVLAALNRSLARQRTYERWITPLLSAGVIGFHLKST